MADTRADMIRRMSKEMVAPDNRAAAKRRADDERLKHDAGLAEKMKWSGPFGNALSQGAMRENLGGRDAPSWGGSAPPSHDSPINSDDFQVDMLLPAGRPLISLGKAISGGMESLVAKQMAKSAAKSMVKDMPMTGPVTAEMRLAGSGLPVGPRLSADPVLPEIRGIHENLSRMDNMLGGSRESIVDTGGPPVDGPTAEPWKSSELSLGKMRGKHGKLAPPPAKYYEDFKPPEVANSKLEDLPALSDVMPPRGPARPVDVVKDSIWNEQNIPGYAKPTGESDTKIIYGSSSPKMVTDEMLRKMAADLVKTR